MLTTATLAYRYVFKHYIESHSFPPPISFSIKEINFIRTKNWIVHFTLPFLIYELYLKMMTSHLVQWVDQLHTEILQGNKRKIVDCDISPMIFLRKIYCEIYSVESNCVHFFNYLRSLSGSHNNLSVSLQFLSLF